MLQVVLADPDRVSGVLLNLYTNAAKFTRQGSIQVRALSCLDIYCSWPSLVFLIFSCIFMKHRLKDPGRLAAAHQITACPFQQPALLQSR